MRRFLLGIFAVSLMHCGSTPAPSMPDSGGGNDAQVMPDAPVKPAALQNAQQGDPQIATAHQLAFGPDAILVVGDGAQSRVVAIDTKDASKESTAFPAIPDFRGKVAAAMGGGVMGTDVQISDFAVNPINKRLYVSVRRISTNSWAIVKVKSDGSLELYDTSDVTYASVTYAQGASIVRDIGWAKGHVVLTATKSGWTNATVVTIPNGPFTHDASANVATTKSYHRTHTAWETNAPIDRFATIDGDDPFIAASYTCAPVVRFKLSDLAAGPMQVTGVTPFDLGPGKQLTDLALYDKGGESYLLIIANNGFGQDFAARVKRSLLDQSSKVDTQAPILFNTGPQPLHPDATHAPTFDDAARIATREGSQIVVLRLNGTLEIADAP